MALATTDDVEARLGRSLTGDEFARISGVLDDVSSSVAVRTGQTFERGTHTLRARVKRGYVRRSQRPVHDVDSVTDRFGTAVDFEWDGLDRVHVQTQCLAGRAPVQVVDVTYDASPDEPPAAIVGVVCSVALRTIGADPLEAGVVSESIDGYSYRLGSASGAGSYGLLPAEADILARHSRPYGNIRTAS